MHTHPHTHDETHTHSEGAANLQETKALLLRLIPSGWPRGYTMWETNGWAPTCFLAPKLAPDRPPVDIKARENAAAGRAVNKEAMDPFHEKCGYIVFFAVSIGLLLSSTLGVPPGLSPLWVRCWW